jgi:hypothetical protein
VVEIFNKTKDPAMLFQNYIFMLMFCILDSLLKLNFFSTSLFSGGWSNVVIFNIERKFNGNSLLDVNGHYGIQFPGVPIMYGTYSYRDTIVVQILGDRAIFKGKNDAKKFLARFEHELNCYSKL